MNVARGPLLIASRRSPLARTQAGLVGAALRAAHPGLTVDFCWIESEGDQRSSVRKDAKGIFTRTVEEAVLDGRAHLAVHSMKDMPVAPQPRAGGLVVVAVPRRGPVEDCLVAADGTGSIDALSRGAVVGTSSPRRAAQLRRLRPDLVIKPIAGNVGTRLDRVIKEHRYDATILAAAGLARLGLKPYFRTLLPLEAMLPAAAQGALAIQCRADDTHSIRCCLALVHTSTAAAVGAERAVMRRLGGDCRSRMAALAEVDATTARLRARVLSPDGAACANVDCTGSAARLDRLVDQIVAALERQGAGKLIREGAGSVSDTMER